jgi:nucleoid-associated protein YgaU
LPGPNEQATGAVPPADMTAAAPSFDVVRAEPSGEGVIAGRAEPGWTVSVESAGTQLAEVKADEQGEWTVVLDTPLPAGDHVLSLKAVSPDAARALASKQTVPVAVVGPAKKSVPVAALAPRPRGALPRAQEAAPGALPRAGRPSEVSPSAAPALPQTAAVDEGKQAPPGVLPEQLKPGTYTIQRGDTLWAIAERYLGAGWRYTSIFRDNRTSIKNPNLIHPEQTVKVPEE